ncbi:nucleolar MIF4G domain-containing protein 1, partial [Clarias magur]
MKPKFSRKGGGRGRQPEDKLHKFMVSVQKFVENEGGQEGQESHSYTGILAKRKSRKEMRREKRKMKKRKKKVKDTPSVEESEQSVSVESAPQRAPSSPSAIKSSVKPQSNPGQDDKPKRKVRFQETASQPPEKRARVQAVRRKALMEANEEEDREIRRLEKRLGLHKRRNKKSLPQSFITDGLDYILGILEPGEAGLYHSDEEEGQE